MKSLKSIYDTIWYMMDELEAIDLSLIDKRDSIEERADNLGRDMTSKEQERFDYLDSKIYNIEDCVESLENARMSLEDYI